MTTQPDFPNAKQIIAWAKKHAKTTEYHGKNHWMRVYSFGQTICSAIAEEAEIIPDTEQPNKTVVALFAFLHDSCRQNDYWDEEHGARAAETIVEIRHTLLDWITDEEFETLQKACREHTITAKSDNLTINVCFDSDRLDLTRVGEIPDPKRMCTAVGAAMAQIEKEKYLKSILYD